MDWNKCPHCDGEGLWYVGVEWGTEVEGCYHCRGTGKRHFRLIRAWWTITMYLRLLWRRVDHNDILF